MCVMMHHALQPKLNEFLSVVSISFIMKTCYSVFHYQDPDQMQNRFCIIVSLYTLHK